MLMPYGRRAQVTGPFGDIFGALTSNVAAELLPVKVDGNVQTIINRNQAGWVVTLVNNEGVYKFRSGEDAEIKPEERIEATVTFLERAGGGNVSRVSEWTTDRQLPFEKTQRGTTLRLTIPAGDLRILAFECSK
jgi:hypothetical protein